MKAKTFRCLALILGLALLTAGCGGSDQPQPGAEESEIVAGGKPVTLTWWWWGTGDVPKMADWVEWVSDAYEQKHPNVTIKPVEQTDNDLIPAFEAAAAAKRGPDIAAQWAGTLVMKQVWAGAVSPLSDFVNEDEMATWLNVGENEFEEKIWGAPIYIVGLPVVYNKELFERAGLDAENPPATWDDLLAACDKLKAAGITPIVGGDRGGFEGSWWFSLLAKEVMDSPDDLKQAVLGQKDWSEFPFSAWLERLDESVKRGCWNEDVSSLELQEKYDVFNAGEAAMVMSIDGAVLESAEALGAENIGVVPPTPLFGEGEMADWYTATQSISHFITSWSPNKEVAADFIKFWHSPESVSKWYELTGTAPADEQFDPSTVEDPVRRMLFELDQKQSVWLTNFEPAQVFEQADIPGGQEIFAQTASPDEVVDLWDTVSERWRNQNPEEADNYARWVAKTE